MEQGEFTVLELLITNGRLTYSDYERWRMGELEFLDQAFLGNPERIRTQLVSAIAYATKIGLLAEPQEFNGWNMGNQARILKMSADKTLHQQLCQRFVSKQDSPQMDLFFNSPATVLANSIIDALASRSVGDAQKYLDKLYQQAPNHAELAVFDLLVDALSQSYNPVIDAGADLLKLQQLISHTKRLLGTRSRDFLVPMWRRLAGELEGCTFSNSTPDLHGSYVLAQALDWPGVSKVILGEPGWQSYETLCLRLAESGYLRRQRSEALTAWCHLCWQFSISVPGLLDTGTWPDSNITNLWYQFCGLEDQLELAEALPTEYFPAWLLLVEPGLSLILKVDLPTVDTAASHVYRVTHHLADARRERDSPRELELRKELQSRQPALLGYLKSRL